MLNENHNNRVPIQWLKTHRNPLHKVMEKMKQEMMLLGFISLLLAATPRIISGICIDSKFYNSKFSQCTREEVEESINAEHAVAHARKHLIEVILHHSIRRNLKAQYHHHQGCPEVGVQTTQMQMWADGASSMMWERYDEEVDSLAAASLLTRTGLLE
ncbi:hypothetical protein ABZP36_020867 [Zizania latifolia]